MVQHYVYKFHAKLSNYEPEIWRAFEVDGNKTMAQLAYIVMQASHLFYMRDNQPSYYEEEGDIEVAYNRFEMAVLLDEGIYHSSNERILVAEDISINNVSYEEGDKIILIYDFGDEWQVTLTLEDIAKKEVSLKNLPRVLDGAGFGILEDVGGTYGLAEIAENLKSGKIYEHNEWLVSLAREKFDLESFDIEEMNQRLKKYYVFIKIFMNMISLLVRNHLIFYCVYSL